MPAGQKSIPIRRRLTNNNRPRTRALLNMRFILGMNLLNVMHGFRASAFGQYLESNCARCRSLEKFLTPRRATRYDCEESAVRLSVASWIQQVVRANTAVGRHVARSLRSKMPNKVVTGVLLTDSLVVSVG
jgi:hypothetical protein